jgi:hypothetical protein
MYGVLGGCCCCCTDTCEQVQFVLVELAGLSLMSVVTHGLHAMPVLQVNAGVS